MIRSILLFLALASAANSQLVQLRHWSGQSVSPAYEGYDANPDGSFNMWFGYMNRNYEEEPDIPVGPNNSFEPGPADRGQPTHFAVRRHNESRSLCEAVIDIQTPGILAARLCFPDDEPEGLRDTAVSIGSRGEFAGAVIRIRREVVESGDAVE